MYQEKIALNVFFNKIGGLRILHEASSAAPVVQHFFISINFNQYLKDNPIVLDYVLAHQEKYPIRDLSDVSMEYIQNDKEFAYLFLASISTTDPLFLEKKHYLNVNKVNHLHEMWVGEPFDKDSDFANKNGMRLETFKLFASNVKDDIKFKIKEKAPILKNKIKGLGKIIKNKIK